MTLRRAQLNEFMMEAEPNDETGETGSQSQSGSEETPKSKLRDLKPEKDPMGAWNKGAPQSGPKPPPQ